MSYQNPLSVKDVQSEVDKVKDIMNENVGQILDNLEKGQDLTKKTEELANESTSFKKKSTQLKRQTLFEKWKLIGGMSGCGLIILIMLIILIYNKVKN